MKRYSRDNTRGWVQGVIMGAVGASIAWGLALWNGGAW